MFSWVWDGSEWKEVSLPEEGTVQPDLTKFILTIDNTINNSIEAIESKQHAPGAKWETPVTVQEEGMNRYQAARELRQILKWLTGPSIYTIREHVLEAKAVVIKSKATKRQREEAFNTLLKQLDAVNFETQKHLQRAKVLVQHLPTQPNLPENKAENVVTAIVAVLKSNNLIK